MLKCISPCRKEFRHRRTSQSLSVCLSVCLSFCLSAENLKLPYYSSCNARIRYAGSFQQYPSSEGHVRVEYEGYISKKRNGRFGGISVSQTHLVFFLCPHIERAYCFTIVHLSIRSSVSQHKLNMKT